MKIALIEDNSAIRKTVSSYLSRSEVDTEIVFETDNVKDGIRLFEKHQVDLAILDVEIKGGLIFDVLNAISSLNFNILFLSSHGSYALDAFRYSAFNFIVKPIDFDQLNLQLFRILKVHQDQETTKSLKQQLDFLQGVIHESPTEKIALPGQKGVDFHRISEIAWVEADSSYCKFHFKDRKEIIVSRPLKEFSDILMRHNFFRTHRSSMINLGFIKQYIKGDGGVVVLENGSEIQVSRRRKDPLIEILTKN
ncbi:MAG: LytTR family DNA-binding domain-containing protein [Crocinitomicaceae bacterium]|nr:LytTR family DNA-binding domain-containing protein [Crocinitomicaceae bacterium]